MMSKKETMDFLLERIPEDWKEKLFPCLKAVCSPLPLPFPLESEGLRINNFPLPLVFPLQTSPSERSGDVVE